MLRAGKAVTGGGQKEPGEEGRVRDAVQHHGVEGGGRHFSCGLQLPADQATTRLNTTNLRRLAGEAEGQEGWGAELAWRDGLVGLEGVARDRLLSPCGGRCSSSVLCILHELEELGAGAGGSQGVCLIPVKPPRAGWLGWGPRM